MRVRSTIGDIVLPKYNLHLGTDWLPVTDELGEKLKDTNYIEIEGKPKKSKDINGMSKDELLDYTAVKGIEADYKMSKKRLKELINDDSTQSN